MPRYREPYTLYRRKGKHGSVWYYRCYSPTGERSCGKSTGQTSKALAMHYCQELIASGQLWTGKVITFRQYAEHFFDDDSQWVLEKTYNGTKLYSQRTIISYRHVLADYLLPFFGKYKITDIRTSVIKKFRITLSEQKLKNVSINNYVGILSVILKTALADNIINFDPTVSLAALPEVDSVNVEAFTREQIINMFSKKWRVEECRVFCLTGALTGMRISEILAIRKENLFENYIDLRDQVQKGELVPLKTKIARYVPIPKELYVLLNSFITDNFCFTHDNNFYRTHLYKNCGVDNMSEKGLRFHSLRHFANTDMLAHNISENKVKAVLGHSSGKGSMTDRYSNWKPELMPEVYQWQEELISQLM